MKLLIGLFVGMGMAMSSAHPLYPTVADLEAALHLSPGQQLPKDVQASNGLIFHSYYDGAKELSDGRYAIIVKLAQ